MLYNIYMYYKERMVNMQLCPFLSNEDSKVQCFKECEFYNYQDNGGKCPFKDLNTYGMNTTGTFPYINTYEDDFNKVDISIVKEYYEKSKSPI